MFTIQEELLLQVLDLGNVLFKFKKQQLFCINI